MLCQYLAMSCDPVIVIHGGAWAVPDHLAEASRRGVREAARAGHRVLASGGSAVEAVTAAVKVLEDDPAFDAGARMEDGGFFDDVINVVRAQAAAPC